jgi:Protein of unknown function (DUF2950)
MTVVLTRLTKSAVLAAVFGMVLFLAHPARGQSDGQKTFGSSKEAVDAFVQVARDGNVADAQAILGPGSEQIVSSGDDVADKNARDRFVSDYETKHSLVQTGANQFTLNVGSQEWPVPVPLIEAKNNQWYWDGAAGREEILYRRIGHNELAAINVCKGVVAAQRDYAAIKHDGEPAGKYAPKIVSTAGKQDGLYWDVNEGEAPSPAGPLLAQANAEGYDVSGKRTPYHGYYYRMLKEPGGFGFLAYPAEYLSSGVMTFIVDQSGVIYQKDLGDKTSEIAQQMTDYQRDKTWKAVK